MEEWVLEGGGYRRGSLARGLRMWLTGKERSGRLWRVARDRGSGEGDVQQAAGRDGDGGRGEGGRRGEDLAPQRPVPHRRALLCRPLSHPATPGSPLRRWAKRRRRPVPPAHCPYGGKSHPPAAPIHYSSDRHPHRGRAAST